MREADINLEELLWVKSWGLEAFSYPRYKTNDVSALYHLKSLVNILITT